MPTLMPGRPGRPDLTWVPWQGAEDNTWSRLAFFLGWVGGGGQQGVAWEEEERGNSPCFAEGDSEVGLSLGSGAGSKLLGKTDVGQDAASSDWDGREGGGGSA